MKWFLILLVLSGCARITSLNLNKHQFGALPTKIIWFQIAGLEEEHLAMLRFPYSADRLTAFEESTCIGKTWNYNLYDLRPNAQASFLAQLTGKKNIKNTCEDASLRPIWNFLISNGYSTGILENGASPEQSLVSLNKCGEDGLVFLSTLYFWLRQRPVADAETFHYSEEVPMKPNQLIYDRTCGKNNCSSTITEDFKSIYQQFRRVSRKHVLIIRDFTYLNALKNGDFIRARDILSDLERSLSEALSYSEKYSDYLVLVTTGESKIVELPEQGKAFFEFEKSGKNARTHRAKLTNLVLASGARAENFCGIYDDADIFERILSGPKQQGLEFKFINPFK